MIDIREDREKYVRFAEKFGLSFRDERLLIQAFIHRSYINENKNIGFDHNERLEFLGDAVLELVVTRFLFDRYPETKEGVLTAYRSALVRTESISSVAREMGMNDLLLLSKGEARDEGKARDYILANTFEAFIGAVYLDQGYASAEELIGKVLLDRIDTIIEEGTWRDAKSYVQEQAQEHYGTTPRYELVSEDGPDHDKHFVMAIYFGDRKVAEGEGNSKQRAQQDAAQNALKKEGWH